MKDLNSLTLRSSMITGATLKQLSGLEQLASLDLRVSKLTDDGLKELSELKQLKRLHVSSLPTTDEGITELKKTLVETNINPREESVGLTAQLRRGISPSGW